MLLTAGFRGGAPPGRRVSRRVGGQWRGRGWAVRFMTLFIEVPVRRARSVPGGNSLVGILYGARERGGKDEGRGAEGAERFTYPGEEEGAEPQDPAGAPGECAAWS
ncbi:hypothetical protein GCM10010339_12210 [Streptomyces alanosinicus]|uniref:Uncharacterized protein n=1 Tax=Streptomyces alanosinicus TaxID=68171 RepID=A0A918YDB2_9ACTN|nr:hypothetical protein GCM10010339_12210 [Streptomyces alanosinicus]